MLIAVVSDSDEGRHHNKDNFEAIIIDHCRGFDQKKISLVYFRRIKANTVNRFDDAPIYTGISHTKHSMVRCVQFSKEAL